MRMVTKMMAEKINKEMPKKGIKNVQNLQLWGGGGYDGSKYYIDCG